MVFVPSVNGLSHNIAEYTTPADIEAGANVLLQVVLAHAFLNERSLADSRRPLAATKFWSTARSTGR